ncbi:prostatic acid phosphatase [Octopus sinensis]|uniref:acid phosphatase n=1 Tax=Octopus sinensis TaxID=2607531 RepID=A0A6P7T5E0_9MOLL|nr:prostatic acid phosphatase [Octopus sinensis]
MQLGIGYFLLLLPTVWADDLATLRLVNLVYRHGDRSPIDSFPTDMHKEGSWPQGFGWLSNIGKLQQYHLGKFLRQRYNGFLNETYIHDEINVQSSAVQRCLMSAYSNLAGLYPPDGGQIWNSNISWQPIPVSMIPTEEDSTLQISKDCPRYDMLKEQELKTHAIKEEEKKNKPFYKFLSRVTGGPKENISYVWMLADTLICERHHNFSRPSWLNETVYNKLIALNTLSFTLLFGTPEMARLKGGPLLKTMLNNMQNKIHSKPDFKTKLFMYSAHDKTVAALSHALKIFNHVMPPYASTLILELHQNNLNKYFVRILYKNTTMDLHNYMQPPVPLKLKDCPVDCPFEAFVELTKDAIPTDWLKECQIPALFETWFWIMIISFCLLCLLLVTLFWFHMQRKHNQDKYASLLSEDSEMNYSSN